MACDRVVFSGPATGVYAQTPEGWLGILPGHAPAAFALADHALRVTTPEGTRAFRVRGGTLYVDREGVTVLTPQASAVR